MLRISAINVGTAEKKTDKSLGYKYHAVNNKDTVEVIVFDPHETDSPVGQDWRERPLLLFVHQKAHEMLNLRHVHISTVISAHKDLKGTDSICE